MNKNKILILLGIFIVLLIIVVYPWAKDRLSDEQQAESLIDFSEFTKENVNKIVIKKPEDEKVLENIDGQWKINEFNASIAEVDSFFDKTVNINAEKLISKNPDNFQRLGIDNVDAYTVIFFTGDKEHEFVFSKNDYATLSFNIKPKDKDEVYQTDDLMPDQIAYVINQWRDKTIAQIRNEEISRIEIYLPDDNYKIKKQDTGWMLDHNEQLQNLNPEKMQTILNSFINFEATDFLNEEQRKELDDTKEKTVLKIYNFSDEVLLENYLIEKDLTFWMKVVGHEEYYLMNATKIPEGLFDVEGLIN